MNRSGSGIILGPPVRLPGSLDEPAARTRSFDLETAARLAGCDSKRYLVNAAFLGFDQRGDDGRYPSDEVDQVWHFQGMLDRGSTPRKAERYIRQLPGMQPKTEFRMTFTEQLYHGATTRAESRNIKLSESLALIAGENPTLYRNAQLEPRWGSWQNAYAVQILDARKEALAELCAKLHLPTNTRPIDAARKITSRRLMGIFDQEVTLLASEALGPGYDR